MIKVHRMVSIQIRARWDGICIPIPDRPGVVGRVQHERISVFAQSVQTRAGRQAGAETEVLRLEDQGGGAGVEKDLAAALPGNGEAEWVLLVLEDQVGGGGGGIALSGRACKDGRGDLVNLICRVLDQDMEAGVYLPVSSCISIIVLSVLDSD